VAQVFISFVHEDGAIAKAVQELLQRELALDDVFLSADKSQVFAGDFWLDKIREALESAQVVVLLLSARSLSRSWVNFEAGAAWLAGKKIVPCCYGRLTKDTLPHPYSGIQALNIPDESHYLVQSVHHHLGLTTPEPESPLGKAVLRALRGDDDASGPWSALDELTDPYNQLQNALSKFEDIPARRTLTQQP
jgi:hypothetical protein